MFALAILLLTGCAANSLNDLYEKGYQQSDVIPVNYQAAFRNLRMKLDECIGLNGRMLDRTKINNQIYTDIEEGQFTWVMTNAFSSDSPMTDIRLKKIDKNNTKIVVTSISKTSINNWYEKYKSWASGNFTPCR